MDGKKIFKVAVGLFLLGALAFGSIHFYRKGTVVEDPLKKKTFAK